MQQNRSVYRFRMFLLQSLIKIQFLFKRWSKTDKIYMWIAGIYVNGPIPPGDPVAPGLAFLKKKPLIPIWLESGLDSTGSFPVLDFAPNFLFLLLLAIAFRW